MNQWVGQFSGRTTWLPDEDSFQPRTVAMAPADMYGDGSLEMLVLEENGDLWQKDSPVYVRGKPISEGERR